MTNKCKIEGCNKPSTRREYCNSHYYSLITYGDPNFKMRPNGKKICSVDGCNNDHYGVGYCQYHYQINHRYGDPLYKLKLRNYHKGCFVKRCKDKHGALGFCRKHVQRWLRGTLPIDDLTKAGKEFHKDKTK